MFDRFIRFAQAKKALHDQRFEDALRLAADPVIASDRRAAEVRLAGERGLLERARQQLAGGDPDGAQRVLADLREASLAAEVAQLRRDCAVALASQQEQGARLAQALAAARAAAHGGRFAEVESLLAGVPADTPARRDIEAGIAARRRQAQEWITQSERALAQSELAVALELAEQARVSDPSGAATVALFARLPAALAQPWSQEFAGLVARDELALALEWLRRACQRLPESVSQPPFVAPLAQLRDALLARLRRTDALADAATLAYAVVATPIDLPEPTRDLCDALVGALPETQGTPITEALLPLAAAARVAGADRLAAAVDQRLRSAGGDAARLAAVRAAIDRGDFDAAQAGLDAVFAEDPLHAAARREQALVEDGVAALARRLMQAKDAAARGRLREACAGAAAIAGSAAIAKDAQRVVAEVRARMSLVDRGLDEVRVALHGRAAATLEGVRHCLRRLEELSKVQTDHEDLPQALAAVATEVEALQVCEAIAAHVQRVDLDAAAKGFVDLLAFRPRLLAPERLDARIADLADALARHVDVALAEGRLEVVESVAAVFAQLGSIGGDHERRAAEWTAAIAGHRRTADEWVAVARTRFAERDLAAGESALERALTAWRAAPEARALATEAQRVRQQTDDLARVEALARARDFQGAGRKLAAMGGSPLLRTRIYDMKQDLARAQGLEASFLLRVDEGGEHLVLRGESVCFGNLRHARADLPVLANLAARHASVRRSMSFHGGMRDLVVAEEGEVRVGGERVADHVLAHGDRVQLGPSFGFTYRRPTTRSLSVALTLQSGFQVAGTDRVLLMKDRGRDGRVLLGPGSDVHVRVARATGEVEVFATPAGQIQVAASEGTIDGVPFRGEHPVAAGSVVEAAGISFVLLPWRPGS